MRKLIILLFAPFALLSQTVFTENMGTPSGTTAIASNTFQNSGTYTYTGTADIRVTLVSSGYSTASGSGNVFFTNTIGRTFEISGINTTGMSNLLLYLGHYKSTTAGNNELTIEVSPDGTTYTALSYSRPTGTGTASWLYINPTGTIPSTSNLRIRFTQASSSTQFRIDDIKLEECKPSLVGSSQTGLSEQCTFGGWTYYGNSTDRYFAIRKNGNTISATVDITVNGTTYQPYTSTSSNGANQEHASYLLGRYWNVTCTGCTYALGGGVDVRFYYHSNEVTNAQTERDNAWTALKGAGGTNTNSLAVKSTALEWFKTNSSNFAPSNFTGNNLTVAHTKLTGTLGTQNSVNYVEFTGITSFSGGTGGFSYGPASGSGGNGLPVTWAGIVVNKNQRENELVWKTASEQNTSHFEVESSEDGANFKTISGKILAAGNSQDLLAYSFVDNNYFPITYYRVKQIDLEGSFDYSKIVVAKREFIDVKEAFDANVFSISNNTVGVELKNADSQVATTIQLIDVSGKVLETVSSDASIQTLDISKLQSGIYFVQVQNADKVCTKKIAKF